MRLFFKILLFVITVACMVSIFAFSSQNSEKSNSISMSVSEKLAKKPSTDAAAPQTNDIWQFNGLVRKYAHFVMFFILGTSSTALALLLMPEKRLIPVMLALLLCLFWAATDEIHQLYVPGRTGQLKDVVIDFSGSLLAAVLALGVRCIAGIKSNKE